MRNEALRILDRVKKGRKRSFALMRSPGEADNSWHMHVPKQFNSALDIRRNSNGDGTFRAWTQGANFSFAVGDTLYDADSADAKWETTLQRIQICFQVTYANPVTPASDVAPRHPGSVTFNVLKPEESRSRLFIVETRTVSQDDFVRTLIEDDEL